ncbi:hypothetical protein Poli38472_014008 [Pythium oligandrum]|uniref:USP domain-containing protein n=1 Tax=Pythium oligandrum TaxID=41045 RepID=A0A8K1CN52_PYTOL|nr:hypothetical protein Poli38472_014008 [Pythium oligandrum]|eukprot:TMW66696.1 hypothetical protein Poli38472_014008 [Pythium oligandrum]
MTSGPPSRQDVAAPTDADTVITFGDFTEEEAIRALHIDEEKAKAEANAAPAKPMSWAAALAAKTEAPKPAPPPVSPWGVIPTPAAATNGHGNGTDATAFVPLKIEDAIQKALESLDVTAPAKEMKKRGLVNQGNTCFQNVIMQSVLSCPPFVNLLAEISNLVVATPDLLSKSSSFRGWRNMVAFTREFEEPTLAQLQRLGSSVNDIQRKVPMPIKISGYFMDVLSAFQKMLGEQEDALEFLEFFLDYLHSEYEQSGLTLPASCEKQTKQVVADGDVNGAGSDEATGFEMDDGWAEVGKRGKSSVLRQNQVDSARSPINWLFKGTIRAETKQTGKKQSSITIEPFHCLHLHLDHDPSTITIPGVPTMKAAVKAYTVEDMIRKSFEVETIEGSAGSPPMKRVTLIDSLPVVLTLNIKRFSYHPELGPVKLQQFVKYPASFAFPVDLLSSTCRAESGGNGVGDATSGFTRYPPVYELFAVVSHHGKYVVGGHYTSMCRDNKDQWFQYNDEHVLSVTEASALAENAFLLFYIRTNNPVVNRPPPVVTTPSTIPGQGKKKQQQRGNRTSASPVGANGQRKR